MDQKYAFFGYNVDCIATGDERVTVIDLNESQNPLPSHLSNDEIEKSKICCFKRHKASPKELLTPMFLAWLWLIGQMLAFTIQIIQK